MEAKELRKELLIESLLTISSKLNSKFSIKFVDDKYYTTPINITKERLKKSLDDFSVESIRIDVDLYGTNPTIKEDNKELICPTCNTKLDQMDNGQLFCPSCLKGYIIKEEDSDKVVYSDGKDYSHLEANTDEHPEHSECVHCGSSNQTITNDADICHDCGIIYT